MMNMEILYILVTLAVMATTKAQVFPVPSYFYPLGPGVQDLIAPVNDDSSTPTLTIGTPFPFFGQLHTSLIVNTNGAVSFLSTLSQFVVETFPFSGRRLIAPFWADVDTRRNDGRVYYRETTDAATLSRCTADVKDAFCDQSDFDATWAFVVTWYRVTYYGGDHTTTLNTFQLVLITDGQKSFAMFNYGDINWTLGTASDNISAQAGYTADSAHYFNIPGSLTDDIVDIETTTNVRQPGRWFFRLDADRPCCCGGSGKALVDTYDNAQLVVRQSTKFLYSRWNQNPNDPCKFQVRAVVKQDINNVVTDIHFDWLGFAIGVHSGNNARESVNIMFAQDTAGKAVVGIRGQGYSGIVPLTFNNGIAVVDVMGRNYTVSYKNDHLVTLEPDLCPYSFSWQPDGTATKWELWVGSKYQDGTMQGMCGDCNGDAIDDWRMCPSSPVVSVIETNIQPIEVSCIDGKNTGQGYAGGTRLAAI